MYKGMQGTAKKINTSTEERKKTEVIRRKQIKGNETERKDKRLIKRKNN
jgi:hypothetical protein